MEKYEQISFSSEERLEEIQKENNGGCLVEWKVLFSFSFHLIHDK